MIIDKFNETIDIWLNALDSFTLKQLLIKPNEKSWSLGQLYCHIIDESKWYNKQIRISLLDKENSNIATTEKTRILMDRGSFEDIMIKGDPLISENIKQPRSINNLKSELEKLKKSTNEIWATMNSLSSHGKSKHPGMGYMTCFEWLRYSEMHMRHHLKQKERIQKFLLEITF